MNTEVEYIKRTYGGEVLFWLGDFFFAFVCVSEYSDYVTCEAISKLRIREMKNWIFILLADDRERDGTKISNEWKIKLKKKTNN